MDVLDAPPNAPAPAPPAADAPRQRRAGGRRTAHVARQRRRRRRPLRALGGLLSLPVVLLRERGRPTRAPRPAGTRGGWLPRIRRGPGLPGRRSLLVLAGLAALVGAVLGLGAVLVDRTAPTPDVTDGAVAATPADQDVLLLVRTASDRPGAAGMTLLTTGDDGSASATFIPSTTLVEIPGVGLDRVGLAHQYGGADLAAAAVANALGIEVDGVVTVDQAGLGSLLQRTGGAQLEVPDRLVDRAADGTGTLAFDAGEQYLNGLRLAEYWAFEQRGESELDTFPRQQRALDAVLRALDDDALLDQVFGEVPAEVETAVDAATLRRVLDVAATAAADQVLVYQLLPVEPLGSGEGTAGASYRLRDEEVAAMVADHFAGAVPESGAGRVLDLQVLNGVGTPGIGQRVDERLRGLGLRIVRTENARTFEFVETQVLVYEESPAVLEAARQVQEALGVGTIRVSRQPQSVLDLTVVVGGDFIGRGASLPPGL